MATELVEYKGRKIRADANLGWDGWNWCYSIDGGRTHFSRYGPQRYQDTSMADAIAAAKAEIDTEGMSGRRDLR